MTSARSHYGPEIRVLFFLIFQRGHPTNGGDELCVNSVTTEENLDFDSPILAKLHGLFQRVGAFPCA